MHNRRFLIFIGFVLLKNKIEPLHEEKHDTFMPNNDTLGSNTVDEISQKIRPFLLE